MACDGMRVTHVGKYDDRFFFATIPNGIIPMENHLYHFFSIDSEIQFRRAQEHPFELLSLSWLQTYCLRVQQKIITKNKIIVHCTSDVDDTMRISAAYLAAAFAILYLGIRTVEDVLAPLDYNNTLLSIPFRFTSYDGSESLLWLEDCLGALLRAKTYGFFDFNNFDRVEGVMYDQNFFGDVNWIVPEKFLTFAPPDVQIDKSSLQPPNTLFNYLRLHEIKSVIRLCEETYNAGNFVKGGFKHYDMHIEDGNAPNGVVLQAFFAITENEEGPVAVHCDTRMGRTATMVAAYLMKHYMFTFSEAMAWVRMCRRRPIIGICDDWLADNQLALWVQGEQHRRELYGDPTLIPAHLHGIYEYRPMLVLDRIREPLCQFSKIQSPVDVGAVPGVNALRSYIEEEERGEDDSKTIPVNAVNKKNVLSLERCDHFSSPEMNQLETMLGALACCNTVQFEGRLKYYNLLIKCDNWGYEFYCNVESICNILGNYDFDLCADEIIKIIESLRCPPAGSLVPRIPSQLARKPLNTLEMILRRIAHIINSKHKNWML